MTVYVPVKVEDRIKSNLSKYKQILKNAKDKDVTEANTVPIVSDILVGIMGWDKYSDITREHETHGTYCDLGIHLGEKLHILIEVKRVGIPLDVKHLKQAKDYASNEGVDWVILTNGVEWDAYKVLFRKPVSVERVFSFNFLEITARNKKAIEHIYSISKEGVKKEALKHVHEESQVTNRFVIAGLVMSEPVIQTLKREIKKLSKGVKVDDAFILNMLKEDVLKGEVVEDEKAKAAQELIKKRMRKAKKK